MIDIVQPQIDEATFKLMHLKNLGESINMISGDKQVAQMVSERNHIPILKRPRCDSVDTLIEKKFRK